MNKQTKRQTEILSYIARYIKLNGFSPTLKEIGDNFEITVKGASDHIRALEKKGLISQRKGLSRTIRIKGE